MAEFYLLVKRTEVTDMTFLEYDEQDILDAAFHDGEVHGHQTGVVEGKRIRTVSVARSWVEKGRHQISKALFAMSTGIAETILDQVLQLVLANPDWDNKRVAEAVQW